MQMGGQKVLVNDYRNLIFSKYSINPKIILDNNMKCMF